VVRHVEAKDEHEGEDEVRDWAGERDDDAVPAGVRVEVAGVGGSLAGCVAGHFDVAAEGQGADAVVGVAGTEAEEARAEADGEDLDADAEELGGCIVAELMDEHHDAEDDKEFDDCGDGHERWRKPL